MNKSELLNCLRDSLCGLPEEELNKSLDFYAEMIDDRVEDGMSEEEAVAALGEVKEIADRILSEIPLRKLVKAKVKKVKPKAGLRPWMIVCLVLGFPVWFPLVIVALVLTVVFYLVFWILIMTFYIVDLSLAIGGIGGIVTGIAGIISENNWSAGLFMIGAGLVSAGLSIPFFPLCGLISKYILKLGKKIVLGIKMLFVGKKEAVEEPETVLEETAEEAEGISEEITEEKEVIEITDITEAAEVFEEEPEAVPAGGVTE